MVEFILLSFLNNTAKMKKATYTIVIVLVAMLSFFSCKKDYHCSCTYNNTVMYNVDLGDQTNKNAKKTCSNYDSTIKGEVWTCTIY